MDCNCWFISIVLNSGQFEQILNISEANKLQFLIIQLDIIDSKFTRYYKNENREKELEDLEWFQKQVTLLVEIRDAIAPQLEIALKSIGNLFVNFLTKVVGKAIGLVGKGILQGLGRSSTK